MINLSFPFASQRLSSSQHSNEIHELFSPTFLLAGLVSRAYPYPFSAALGTALWRTRQGPSRRPSDPGISPA
jgi:hypothetical protein